MPRSRERAKEISAVKSHVCLSSVQAHQARCFSCACCTRLFKARGSAECVRTWYAPFGTRFVLVTNRSRSSSTLEGLVPIPESHHQRRLSLSTASHAHMLAVSIYSHLSGRPRTPRAPARSRRCGQIAGGLPWRSASLPAYRDPTGAGDQLVQQLLRSERYWGSLPVSVLKYVPRTPDSAACCSGILRRASARRSRCRAGSRIEQDPGYP